MVHLCYGKNTKQDEKRATQIMLEKCPKYMDVRLGAYQKLQLYAAFYLEKTESKKPSGERTKQNLINSFVERWKKLDVNEMLPYHLQTWLDEKKFANNPYNCALTTISSMFAWGVRQGLLPKNPVFGLKRKPPVYKDLDCIVSEEEHAKLMAAACPEGKRMLTALFETGCRPSEIRLVRKHHYDAKKRCWVFGVDECKTKNRRVYLSKTMVRMCDELVAQGRDHLFRNPMFHYGKQKPWADNEGNRFSMWFRRLKEKTDIDHDELTAVVSPQVRNESDLKGCPP